MSLTEAGLLQVFQTIIDNLPSGVTLLDKDLRFVAWNSEIKQLLSFPDELFNPDDPPEMAKVARFNARRGEYGPGDPEEQARAVGERARQIPAFSTAVSVVFSPEIAPFGAVFRTELR